MESPWGVWKCLDTPYKSHCLYLAETFIRKETKQTLIPLRLDVHCKGLKNTYVTRYRYAYKLSVKALNWWGLLFRPSKDAQTPEECIVKVNKVESNTDCHVLTPEKVVPNPLAVWRYDIWHARTRYFSRDWGENCLGCTMFLSDNF